MAKVNIKLATQLCAYLNELLEYDHEAIHDLVEARVPCSATLAEHPTVQVADAGRALDSGYLVGVLGVLNGYLGVYNRNPAKGCGPLAAAYDDDGDLVRFVLTREAHTASAEQET